MKSLIFPDTNVWMALALADHTHAPPAQQWYRETTAATIAFSRLTQISVLRLLTTAAVMNGKPLTMRAAWAAYDQFFDEDDRVAFLPEPRDLDLAFRPRSESRRAAPKLWADVYIAAFAVASGGVVVTFDSGMTRHGVECIVLESPRIP